MTRRVLVSGGAGFIGSHVVEAYLAAGDEVSVLDDLSTGKAENVPSAAKLVRADIRSPEARALVAGGGFTVLNHHAAQMDVRRSVEDPVFDAQVNVLGLLNLLEGARAGGVHRIVFASSGGTVYGDGAPTPTTETAGKLPAIRQAITHRGQPAQGQIVPQVPRRRRPRVEPALQEPGQFRRRCFRCHRWVS